MGTFRDCIVSLIDLNNIGALLAAEKGRGVRVMRDLHELVANHSPTLKSHEEVCFWQDSALLLAFVDASEHSYERVMSDVVRLKTEIDALHRCHAVCVKGQSFPSPSLRRSSQKQPRSIYLKASSLAFSNCFKIEERLKGHKADWYIDPRITRRIDCRDADTTEVLGLQPRGVQRKIHMFRGSFDAAHSPQRRHDH